MQLSLRRQHEGNSILHQAVSDTLFSAMTMRRYNRLEVDRSAQGVPGHAAMCQAVGVVSTNLSFDVRRGDVDPG